jgi:hypothetical protein
MPIKKPGAPMAFKSQAKTSLGSISPSASFVAASAATCVCSCVLSDCDPTRPPSVSLLLSGIRFCVLINRNKQYCLQLQMARWRFLSTRIQANSGAQTKNSFHNQIPIAIPREGFPPCFQAFWDRLVNADAGNGLFRDSEVFKI